jgi:uncharacterized protein
LNTQQAGGSAASPFRQFILKVHARCNLACDHCYVYEHADQSWRDRPIVMSDETMRQTAARIGEHCRVHSLGDIQVVLHGGEPLLAGLHRIRRLARLLRASVPEQCGVQLRMQTNGVLLDDNFCALLVEEGVKVGISLDGDQQANDLHRRYADGRSSYREVEAAVRTISQPRFRGAFSGLLCTIDVASDPIRSYTALCELDPPRIDFLLPHANWEIVPRRSGPEATPHADWLIAVYDRWRTEPGRVPIRVFDSIAGLLAGADSLTESLGLDAADLVVVETDGAIEQVDSLKAAYDGAAGTGFDVHRHSFDDARAHPGFAARSLGMEGLCGTCQTCPVVRICGGGLYAHRYRAGSGFQNPSVYCRDLLKLITHVRDRPAVALRARPVPGETHSLSGAAFDDLAAGWGGAGAVQALVDAQRSLRLSSLVHFVRVGRSADPSGEALAAAWEVLADLHERAPGAVEPVLAHPYIGAWVTGSDAVGGAGRARDLWGLALACSLRAGVPVNATVPLVGGRLLLPTWGALDLAPETGRTGWRTGEIATDPAAPAIVVDGRVVPLGEDPAKDDAEFSWLPVRHLEADGFRVALDDLDPHRDCYHHPAAGRQSPRQFEHWQAAFTDAWELINREFPRYGEGIASGLGTITPLEASGAVDASATHRRVFGAVGIGGPRADPGFGDALALLLLHEFQHVKVGAVLDLVPLLAPGDDARYEVGWRPDPRPLEAVLQGAYAHLAVVEYWHSAAHRSPGGPAGEARSTFLSLRDQTAAAVDVLATSSSLTDLGRRWIGRMQTTVQSWYELAESEEWGCDRP